MRRVFTKFLGAKVNSDDLTISVALSDQAGQASEISMTPDLVLPLTHNLMGSVGYAEHLAEGGVPATAGPNTPYVAHAIPAAAAFFSEKAAQGKYVLTIGCSNGAEYNFSLTEEQRALLLSQA